MAKNRKGRNWIPWMEEKRTQRIISDYALEVCNRAIREMFSRPPMLTELRRNPVYFYGGASMSVPFQFERRD